MLFRSAFTNPAITTDVIVGFPGENEAEFAQTKIFLQQIGFYEMHIFKYSLRSGTRAAQMPDQIPESIKTIRSEELLVIEKAMSMKYRQSALNTLQEVLLEEEMSMNGNSYFIGHTREYIKIAVPSRNHQPNILVEVIPKKMLTDEILV